jgi:hypothetical protein
MANGSFLVQVNFEQPRNAMLTISQGTLAAPALEPW